MFKLLIKKLKKIKAEETMDARYWIQMAILKKNYISPKYQSLFKCIVLLRNVIADVGLDAYEKKPLYRSNKPKFLSHILLIPHVGYVTA